MTQQSASPSPKDQVVVVSDVELPKLGPAIEFERVAILGVPGILALVIVGSICVRYVIYGPEEIPQLLAYALTSIIGFYFGAGLSTGTSRRSGARAADNRARRGGQRDIAN